VAHQGINGFRHSVEARQACCHVRKVEPLGRALAGASGWLTGLRSAQSRGRALTPLAQYDPTYELLKVNPLADWSREQVAAYIADNAVPYNPLHDRGFPSIGCAPCTRAVKVGEPERAGRWWWENDAKKECGLHLRPVPSDPHSETTSKSETTRRVA
jgi:phosphoadenosine phosphosulfate reductase